MRKFFSLIAAVLFAGSMFAADATMTKGTNGYDDFTVNSKPAIKVGTSSKGGDMTVTVGAGATTLTVYAAAWKGVNGLVLNITAPDGVAITPASITLTAEDAFTGSEKAFTVANESAYKFDFVISGAEAGATFTFTTATSKRFLMWGATYDTGEGGDPTPVVDYYVAGSMNGWASAAGNKDYKLAANPGAEGEYMIEMAFAANDAFKVIGYDGTTTTWYPDGMDNNYTITEAGKYTVYFRPAGGQEGWHYGYINAIKIQAITCAEVYALAKNDKVNLLNDVTVTYANGKNVWVKDATASMLIYLSDNTTWKAGDVLSGVAGTVDIFNGVTEIKPSAAQAAAVTATAGEAPAAEVLETVATTDVNKYIVMKNVEFEADAAFAEGTASNITMNGVTVRNNFKNGYAFTAGKKYDVYGVVTIFQSNPQVYFITAEESKTTAIDNAAIETKAIKRIENGKLVIIKNGVRFDAQGARL